MDREKRRSPRIRCRVPCEVQWGGRTSEATVRDVSQGGLSIHCTISPAEGETLHLRLNLKAGRSVDVSGLVWHRRRVRTRDGATGALLGLVVSNPPESFLELSRNPRLLGGSAPAGSAAPRPASAPPVPAQARRLAASRLAPLSSPEPEPAAAPTPKPERKALPDPELDAQPTIDPNEDTLPRVPPPGRRYQVRMKKDASPRSRVLSVEADSPDHAAALALERTGSGWAAIEVNAV